MNTAK